MLPFFFRTNHSQLGVICIIVCSPGLFGTCYVVRQKDAPQYREHRHVPLPLLLSHSAVSLPPQWKGNLDKHHDHKGTNPLYCLISWQFSYGNRLYIVLNSASRLTSFLPSGWPWSSCFCFFRCWDYECMLPYLVSQPVFLKVWCLVVQSSVWLGF